MKRNRWCGFLLALLPVLGSSCTSLEVTGSAGYMHLEMTGDIGLVPTVGGTTPDAVAIDVEDGLRIGEMNTPYARVDFALSGFRVALSGYRFEQDGNSVLTNVFGDIPSGTAVSTDLSLLNLKAAVMYDFGVGPVRISPGIAVDYYRANLDMRSVSPVAFEEIDFEAPVPMPFLEVELSAPFVSLTANIGGLAINNVADTDGLFWDAEAFLTVTPLPMVDLFVGYRFTRIDAEGSTGSQDFATDILLNGFLVGGSIGF